MKTATNFGRDNLLSLGTCVGRFTKVREGSEEVLRLYLFYVHVLCGTQLVQAKKCQMRRGKRAHIKAAGQVLRGIHVETSFLIC